MSLKLFYLLECCTKDKASKVCGSPKLNHNIKYKINDIWFQFPDQEKYNREVDYFIRLFKEILQVYYSNEKNIKQKLFSLMMKFRS